VARDEQNLAKADAMLYIGLIILYKAIRGGGKNVEGP
jgi:hypothetical protein